MTGNAESLIWRAVLDAKANVRYHDAYRERYELLNLGATLALAVTSLFAFLGAVAMMEPFRAVWPVFIAATAALGVAAPILNYSERAARYVRLHSAWQEVELMWEVLWARADRSSPDLVKEYEETKKKQHLLEGDNAGLRINKRLMRRCQEEVLRAEGLMGEWQRQHDIREGREGKAGDDRDAGRRPGFAG
jgi:hypothetical protein